MKIIKENDYEIRVSKVETKEIVDVYSYTFLLEKRKNILERKEKEMAQRDTEVAGVDILIEECKKLGIRENPLEPIEPIN